MEMREILNYLFEHNKLSKKESYDILTRIGKGEFSESEIASFLTVFLMRKISPAELGGFREALLDLSVPVEFNEFNTIDVCGTGGDEKNTFNISTISSFIIAGAGAKVVKHGNYGVSSTCGSSNIFEHFGYKFSNEQDKLKKELEQVNICYLHAPFFHPAMKHVGPVRKSLKLKTFFNLLGPMVNPSRPKNQIIGVFNEEVQELFHQVYLNSSVNYIILHNLDGYDEISLTDNFRAISAKEDKVYSPESIGLKKVDPKKLFGGDTVEEAAEIFSNILDGNGTESQNSVVLANSAFGLKCYYPEKDLMECYDLAKESLESKKAFNTLKKIIAIQ